MNHFIKIISIALMMWASLYSHSQESEKLISFCEGSEMMGKFYTKIYSEDQGIRKNMAELRRAEKGMSKESFSEKMQSLAEEMIINDLSHQILLRQLVQDCGWPKPSGKTFEEGNAIAAAYMVVQHTAS